MFALFIFAHPSMTAIVQDDQALLHLRLLLDLLELLQEVGVWILSGMR